MSSLVERGLRGCHSLALPFDSRIDRTTMQAVWEEGLPLSSHTWQKEIYSSWALLPSRDRRIPTLPPEGNRELHTSGKSRTSQMRHGGPTTLCRGTGQKEKSGKCRN